jgi:hypothetical protein
VDTETRKHDRYFCGLNANMWDKILKFCFSRVLMACV